VDAEDHHEHEDGHTSHDDYLNQYGLLAEVDAEKDHLDMRDLPVTNDHDNHDHDHSRPIPYLMHRGRSLAEVDAEDPHEDDKHFDHDHSRPIPHPLLNHAEVGSEHHHEKDADHWAARIYTFSSEETPKPLHDNRKENDLDKKAEEKLLAEDSQGNKKSKGPNKDEGKPHHHHNHMIIEIGSQEEPSTKKQTST